MNFISKIFEKLKVLFFGKGLSEEIFSNMGKLASGLGIAKVVSFATVPIITRIYTPDDFGVLSVFTSAITLLVPFAAFLYPIALPLPKNDGLALNIAAFSILFICSITLIISLLFFVLGNVIFEAFNMIVIAEYWWLLAFGVFVASLYELLTHWATRVKAFKEVAKTKVSQAILSAVVKIGLGTLGLKPLGLLIGDIVQRGGGVISLIRSFLFDIRHNISHVSIKRMRFLATYYLDLPKFRLPSQFLLKLSVQAPILFFAFNFGKEVTGQLSLSLMVIGLPITLLGSSTGKAYYAEIAKIGANRRDEILALTKSITKRLSILSLIPTMVLLLFSPFLFQLIFGQEWEQAGIFTSILAFYLFIQFITSPLVNVFNVYNKQRKFLEINIVRTILMGVVFGISFLYNYDVYQTLIFYTIIISSHYIFTGYQVYKVIR